MENKLLGKQTFILTFVFTKYKNQQICGPFNLVTLELIAFNLYYQKLSSNYFSLRVHTNLR